MHQDYVRRLYSRVAAHAAHGYAYIGTHEHGRVVYAVAYETQRPAFFFGGKQFFHLVDLVLRQKLRFVVRHVQFRRHRARNRRVVARQHNRPATHAGKRLKGGRRFVLYLVAYEYAAREYAVFRDVNHRAHSRMGRESDVEPCHKSFVAAADPVALLFGEHAFARYIGKRVTAVRIALIAFAYGFGDGVGRIALGYCRKAQNIFPVFCGEHLRHREIALCQSARFVEHERIRLIELFQVIGAFNQYPVARSGADSRKEGKRNGYDQRAGTGHDQKAERAVYPRGPPARNRAGNYREQKRDYDHCRRVVFCKLGYEVFRL